MCSIASYFFLLIYIVKKNKYKSRRLKIAQQNNWKVKTRVVQSKIKNVTRRADYGERYRRNMRVDKYEYEIDGKIHKLKVVTQNSMPMLEAVYYDAENNNKVLNLEGSKMVKAALLIPVAIFVLIIVVLKSIFGV